MVDTTFAALKDKQDPLVFAALDWAVYLHKHASGLSYIPTDLFDTNGDLQAFADTDWKSAGEIQKKSGLDITADASYSSVEGYGSAQPRLMLPTSESFGINFTAQEWRKFILEMWLNQDLSLISATPGKGFKVRKSAELNLQYYTAVVIAKFGTTAAPIYPYFVFPKCIVTKRGNISGQIGAELPIPLTLTPFEDPTWTGGAGVFEFGVGGSGFDTIAEEAGFASAASAITVHPDTLALNASGNELGQLTVIDNNGFNRTAECTFASSDATKATVSSPGGLVRALAAGSTTITATLGAITDTCVVTVS